MFYSKRLILILIIQREDFCHILLLYKMYVLILLSDSRAEPCGFCLSAYSRTAEKNVPANKIAPVLSFIIDGTAII